VKARSVVPGLTLALAMQACVGVPVAVPEAIPFEELVGTELVVGRTTPDELLDRLGEPLLREGSRWIYRHSRQGWTWLVCGTVILNAGCVTSDRTSKDYILVADFDSREILSSLEVLDSEETCETHRLCFDGTLLMRAATDYDATGESVVEGCLVYVYSEKPVAGRFEIDGRRAGDLVGSGGYHRLMLATGRHMLAIFTDIGTRNEQSTAANVSCAAGDELYLRYTAKFPSTSLDLIDPATAQTELQKRWLARAEVDPAPLETQWVAEADTLVVRNEDNYVRAIRNAGPGQRTRWAASEEGEVCGSHAALAGFGLWPAGGASTFGFSDGANVLDFNAICAPDGQCEFRSLFANELCRVWQDEEIVYRQGARLLVIEPHGDTFRTVYYDDSRHLENKADCNRGTCRLAISDLRSTN